ncbi:MAG: LLM class F420-dependent oxidoreductase [Chloroflexi bacterium]|nr:LLM class F420-dependent oxidoreductase [Chloroflexota bacterium]MQC26176.1 LLM class F420-dependent oxidoreductase [Chloroflexota bacterium]
MRIGVVYPQTEFPPDPSVAREYAQTAENLGYHHLLAYDHVLGANPDRPGGWHGPYTHTDPFLEPFTLFSFLAGLTQRIEFATGILILPQRQTALVAKQAAMVDVLSNGRLRLGVGIGWSAVEYEALNQNFRTRGRRVEEQIEVLNRLWTEPLVTFSGRWHTLSDAGINPMPVQQPIPIWLGGHHENVLRRVAKYGAGWMPNYRTAAEVFPQLDKLDGYLEEAGRNRADIGLEARLHYSDGEEVWQERLAEWQAVPATHITINTMRAGLQSPQEHISAITRFAEIVGLSS